MYQMSEFLENDLAEARCPPAPSGTSEEQQLALAAMTLDAQQSGEEVRNLWIELANAQTLVVRVAPAAALGQEDTV